jgi:hypothetical protein
VVRAVAQLAEARPLPQVFRLLLPNQPTNTGGVFVPSASAAPSVVASAAPVAPSAGPPRPAQLLHLEHLFPVLGSSSGGALSNPCTTEGMVSCVGGSSFQQCASGTWSVLQQMAAGTKCTSGRHSRSTSPRGRGVRFSHGHIHRRHNSYLDSSRFPNRFAGSSFTTYFRVHVNRLI